MVFGDEMKNYRLRERKLRIWGKDYLVLRYLWSNIKSAVEKAYASIDISPLKVLDLGCGHKPYSDLFKDSCYIGLDISIVNTSPDVLADSSNLPIKSASVDIVLSTQVLEHVPEPPFLIREAYRVVKPGGILILTAPFYGPLHEEPYDFYRFTKYGLEHLIRKAGFTHYEICADGGDWAQIFLSINQQLRKRYTAPFRIIMNILGVTINYIFPKESSPSNYTLIATK